MRGQTHLKRCPTSVRFISTPFHAESSIMRQKTGFSVVEMRSGNVAFVSENEGSDLGMPWPNGPPSSDCPVVWHADGPPSSDCPVGWHADGAPRRTQVRGQYLPKTRECVPPFPQGLFMPPKTRPKAFSAAKMLFWLGKHTLIAPIPTYVGICVSPFPQGLFMPQKTRPFKVFLCS